MKNRIIYLLMIALFSIACGESGNSTSDSGKLSDQLKTETPADDGKGVGEVKHVDLNSPLVASMVENGKSIYELKCAACHKLSDQRVVGPGWKGLSEKRKPEWIMNMILNVDVMLEEDAAAYELLKECLVRMPNQNLTTQEARDVLEFIYANDGSEVGT